MVHNDKCEGKMGKSSENEEDECQKLGNYAKTKCRKHVKTHENVRKKAKYGQNTKEYCYMKNL